MKSSVHLEISTSTISEEGSNYVTHFWYLESKIKPSMYGIDKNYISAIDDQPHRHLELEIDTKMKSTKISIIQN